MQPLVSVVVPVFNGMPHLPALVEAIRSQTYSNLDCVFTEGGGSDASADYLASIGDPRFRIVQMPHGTSAAQNWTAASLEARGDFTKLVCQDDLIYPRSIELQVQDLQDHPTALMAIAQRDIVDARGTVLFHRRGLAGLPKSDTKVPGRDVLRACYLQGTNVLGEPLAVLFRAQVLRDSMPWDDTDPLMLDLSTYQKIAPQGDVVLRHESIGAFRVSDSSWSTRIARDQLEQTKRWQYAYAAAQHPTPSSADRARAAIGRHVSTNLRRVAYASLRVRGGMRSSEANR